MRQAGSPLSGLKELSREEMEDAFCELDELFECWQKRLTVNNLSLTERYVEDELNIGIEIRVVNGHHAEQFVAIFQRVNVRKNNRDYVRGVDRIVAKQAPDGDDCLMFVEIVETVQTKEGVALPSSVRLYSSDEFFNRSVGSFEKPFSSVIRQSVEVPFYWEVSILDCALTRDAIRDDKRSSEIVERTSAVMDDVANDATPDFRNGFVYDNFRNIISRLRIVVEPDRIRLPRLEPGDFSIQVLKVLLGPINLYPTTNQWVRSHGANPQRRE